jgi:hypothetical protein
MLRTIASLSLTLAVFALAACGGGSSGSTTPSTPSGPSGTSVTLSVAGAAPSAVAVEIGGGAWATTTLSGGSTTFKLPVGTTTYGAAIVCAQFIEYIVLLTTSDTTTPSIQCNGTGATTSASVSYDVSSITGAAKAVVYIGNTENSSTTLTGTQAFSSAPSGLQDVAVLAYGSAGTDASAVKIDRGVNVGGTIGPVTAVQGVDNTGTAALTINSLPGGYTAQVNADYTTAGGATLLIKNAGPTTSFPTVAAADTAAGDTYFIQAFASLASNQVGIFETTATGGSTSLTLPTPLVYAGPAAAQYPTYTVPSYSFALSGTKMYQLEAVTPFGPEIIAGTSSAYLATVNNTLQVPNLSALAGFSTIAAPAAGNPEDWELQEAVVSSATTDYLFQAPFPVNSSAAYVEQAGQFTVP